MHKKVFAGIAVTVLVLGLSFNVFAQSTKSVSAVTVSPDQANAGEVITITAVVKNVTTQKVSTTVLFTAGKIVLDKKVIVIPSKTSSKVSIEWAVPTVPTDVQVEVISAVGANKLYISNMTGVLGTVTISPLQQPLLSNVDLSEVKKYPIVVTIEKWISATFAAIEPFRIKQAAYFSDRANEVRARIGIAVSEQVGSAVQQKVSKALAPENAKTAATSENDLPKKKTLDNPLDYGVLVGSMALASFFGNMIGFYIGLLLLVLFILRMSIGLITKRT